MYTSGLLKTLSLRRKDDSNIKPSSPSTPPVTHIANCMRPEAGWPAGVLIMDETNQAAVHSRGASIAESLFDVEKVKYKLWPQASSTTSPANTPSITFSSMDSKDHALAAGRSPTSLSDTAIIQSGSGAWPPRRGGSLLRRRNVSVPELNGKIQGPPKIIYEGSFADSPTIPGRPPLRKANTDMPGHERSASVPGTWRESPFSNAMLSGVAGPSLKASPPQQVKNRLAPHDQTIAFKGGKPLSPIFSPVEAKTPLTAIPRSPPRSQSRSPARSPSRSPAKSRVVDFQLQATLPEEKEVPPPVPPKDAPADTTSPVRANSVAKRSQTTKGQLRVKVSNAPPIEIPPVSTAAAQQPQRTTPSGSTHVSPTSRSESTISPTRKTESPDFSMMDRPRPTKSVLRKQRSAPVLPKYTGELTSPTPKLATVLASTAEHEPGDASMPMGLKPMEAVLVLPNSEKDIIRKQAVMQAEQFEILGSKLVNQLSRELRAIDERCEYLRKTYKSLREGRQKLHSRMIAYLKSDSLSFSKERLLKQQEALIELDASIDDWVTKLERAENRRLRLRQKLLEHVAASMTLSTPEQDVHVQSQELVTPPRSPQQVGSPEPLKMNRRDVESIKIYADNQVLSLFNDIEAAVTKMCEAC